MCFRRKTESDKFREDRIMISENEKALEPLMHLAQNDTELIKELSSLKEKIKYLTPSADRKVIDLDKKIKNAIDDLKIALVKADGEQSKKGVNLFNELKLLVSERNTKH